MILEAPKNHREMPLSLTPGGKFTVPQNVTSPNTFELRLAILCPTLALPTLWSCKNPVTWGHSDNRKSTKSTEEGGGQRGAEGLRPGLKNPAPKLPSSLRVEEGVAKWPHLGQSTQTAGNSFSKQSFMLIARSQ